MGSRGLAVIHCNPGVPWQAKRSRFIAEGLKAAGIPCEVTADRFRHDGFPILLGTTFWRDIERDGGEFLLVDRCSFGDTEKFVSLVWNGHGRRGDHRVPENFDGTRWEKHGVELLPWRTDGSQVLLCGQTESYSPNWRRLEDWYRYALHGAAATHFRPHPAGTNPTTLPVELSLSQVREAITLNSSVAVQCVLAGIPTQVHDKGGMALGVEPHGDRLPWCHWLAWTQWSDEEIREGIPWAYLL